MNAGETDPLIRQLREQISDNDRALVETVNKRLQLVARLKRYKASRGIGFVDPEREEWMLQYLSRANRGPLTADGLLASDRVVRFNQRVVGTVVEGGEVSDGLVRRGKRGFHAMPAFSPETQRPVRVTVGTL